MTALSPRAGRQVRELQKHYRDRRRPEAIRTLAATLESAWQIISSTPDAGWPAPRPYPALVRPGLAWIKAGRYWIAYRTTPRLLIDAVFYETADIPGRL